MFNPSSLPRSSSSMLLSLLFPLTYAAVPEDVAVFNRIFGSPPKMMVIKSFESFAVSPDEPCWTNQPCDYERFFATQDGAAALSEAKRIDAKFGRAWSEGSAEFIFNLLLRVASDDLSDALFLDIFSESEASSRVHSSNFLLSLFSFIRFRQRAPFCKRGSLSVVINSMISLCLNQTIPYYWTRLPAPSNIFLVLGKEKSASTPWNEDYIIVSQHLGGGRTEFIGEFDGFDKYMEALKVHREECPIDFFQDFSVKLKFIREAADYVEGLKGASEQWFRLAITLSETSTELRSVLTKYAFRLPCERLTIFHLVLKNPQMHKYFCSLLQIPQEKCHPVVILSSFVPDDLFESLERQLEALDKLVQAYPVVKALEERLVIHIENVKKAGLKDRFKSLIERYPELTFDAMVGAFMETPLIGTLKLKCITLVMALEIMEDYAKSQSPLVGVVRTRQYLGLPVKSDKAEALLKGNEGNPYALVSLPENESLELSNRFKNELTWWRNQSLLLGRMPMEMFTFSEMDNSVLPFIFKTLLYLEGEDNPFMKVSRELLLGGNFSYQPSQRILIHWFGDALVNLITYEVPDNGFAMYSAVYLTNSLLKLKQSPPADCPIEPEEIDELLDLFIGFNASAFMALSNAVNKHLITTMKVGGKVFLIGRNKVHGVGVEVIREEEDSYLVTLLNSGLGLPEHHAKKPDEKRWIFHQSYRLTLKQIEERNFFNVYESEDIGLLYGTEGKLPASMDYENESIASQKNGVCYAKAPRFLLKWYLSRKNDLSPRDYSRYNWWKTWFFKENVPKINATLCDVPIRMAEAKDWDNITVNWNLTRNITVRPAISTAAAIMWHQVMRLLGEAKRPKNAAVQKSIIRMLDSLEMFPALRTAFDLNKV